MTEAHTHFEGDHIMTLQSAIMLYGTSQGAGFATAHDVSTNEHGEPFLLEGHPLTIRMLNELSSFLIKGAGSKRNFNGFLPENVLAVGIGSIVWWLPAADRSISFACDDDLIGNRSGMTPHPSLVFGVNDSGWYVFATKSKARPTPRTEIFQAPYFNVYANGSICRGTTQVPSGATADLIKGWDHAFFSSNFSHPNIHQPEKLVSYQGGAYKFWKDALDKKFVKFPLRVLVGTNHTLEDFITATINGGHL